MECITEAIRKTFVFYISEIALVILFIIIGIMYVCRNRAHSERMGLITIGLIVVLIALLIHSVIPFVSDILQNRIIINEGNYTNILGSDSKSNSSISGMYSVELVTETEELHLTAAPWCHDRFPKGNFHVNAYYTERSGLLLYIEILDRLD